MCFRALSDKEVSSLSSCLSNDEGDVISWTRGKWEVFGDVTVDTSDYQALCEEVFEEELVAVPEAVTFHDATFICAFLSGKIYSADDDKYDPGLLYSKLKAELDIEVRKKILILTGPQH